MPWFFCSVVLAHPSPPPISSFAGYWDEIGVICQNFQSEWSGQHKPIISTPKRIHKRTLCHDSQVFFGLIKSETKVRINENELKSSVRNQNEGHGRASSIVLNISRTVVFIFNFTDEYWFRLFKLTATLCQHLTKQFAKDEIKIFWTGGAI